MRDPESDDLDLERSLREDMALLLAAVREAGALAMEFFGRDVETWSKADRTPVSAVDIAVNDLLRARLCGPRPSYGWLSEENEDEPSRLDCRKVWVVDPIDGTRAFVQGIPSFSISAALVEGEAPVAAAIFNPATDEFFAAMTGMGAVLNGLPVRVSARSQLEGARVLAPRDMFHQKGWPEPWPPMHVENRNSVAYRLALVASGTWDAAISLTPKSDWDVAAGDLIVREAGGVVTTHHGERLRFNVVHVTAPSVIAANPVLHGDIYRRVRHR